MRTSFLAFLWSILLNQGNYRQQSKKIIMVQALTAAIIALFLGVIAFIVRKIKRATLGSEFKDLEKVLGRFGSSTNIKFEIIKDKENVLLSFTPTQLSKFIRLKYSDRKAWKENEYGLYNKVIEDNDDTNVFNIEIVDVSYNGLHIKCPTGWSIVKTDSDEKVGGMHLPVITSSDGNDNIITAKVMKTYLSIEDSVERFIWEEKSQRSKFIRSASKSYLDKGRPSCSVGYAYKYGDSYRYGLVYGCQLTHDLAILLHIKVIDDWSVLCSKPISEIIDTVEYDNTEVHS